jgi:DNA adenine methylase
MNRYREVNPISPVAPYLGGKRNLAKTLIARIEQIEHTTYVEPFVGMGGVFLKRRHAAKCEVINDWGREVANFFRILQVHYIPFMDLMRFQITSRQAFDRLAKTPPESLTDLQRAARFFYLQRTAFGGKPVKSNFGVSTDRGARFDITRLAPMLDDLHDRLSGVVIECLPFADVIQRYDRPSTLFYLDPPYWGNENDYGKDLFSRDDFAAMADVLSALSGRFIMSLNDRPEVRETFKSFDVEAVKTTYTIAAKSAKKVGELIISN